MYVHVCNVHGIDVYIICTDMYIHTYTYIYIYIDIHTYVHIHLHKQTERERERESEREREREGDLLCGSFEPYFLVHQVLTTRDAKGTPLPDDTAGFVATELEGAPRAEGLGLALYLRTPFGSLGPSGLHNVNRIRRVNVLLNLTMRSSYMQRLVSQCLFNRVLQGSPPKRTLRTKSYEERLKAIKSYQSLLGTMKALR